MTVVAVDDLDVDAGLGHSARDLAELTWLGLVQSLHEHLPFFLNANARRFERPASSGPILEEEVSDALAVDDEGASALDAHPGVAQGVAHLGQCARSVFQHDRKILHGRCSNGW